MATKSLNDSPEFKQQIVALCRSGQTQNKLAREYGLARTIIRRWVAQIQPELPGSEGVAQLILVIDIFLTDQKAVDPLSDHLPDAVFDARRKTVIDEALGKIGNDVCALFHLMQQHEAAVGAEPYGVKAGVDLQIAAGRVAVRFVFG